MPFDLAMIKREFVCGGTAGAIGILIGFPFDLVKTQLQSYPGRFPNAWSCFKHTIKEGGVSSLFQGCLPPVLMQGLINSLMFVGESMAMKVLEPHRKTDELGSPLNTFIAGSMGGILQCVVLVPSEVVKVVMQTNNLKAQPAGSAATVAVSGNAFEQTRRTIQQIYRSEGLRGFYKGFGATAGRDIPSVGIYFFIYKNTRDWLGQLESRNIKTEPGMPVVKHEPSPLATCAAGGLAGALSWGLIYPLDVIKTVTQVSSGPAGPGMKSYKDMNSVEVGMTLFRQHGIRAFYHGLGPTVLRAFPVNAATFYFYEKFKVMLDEPSMML